MQQAYTVALSGEVGFRDVQALREELLGALRTHEAVEVHTEGLTGIDIGVMQVLIAAHKSARERDRSFLLRASPTSVLRDTLIRAGLLAPSGQAPFDINWQTRDAAS